MGFHLDFLGLGLDLWELFEASSPGTNINLYPYPRPWSKSKSESQKSIPFWIWASFYCTLSSSVKLSLILQFCRDLLYKNLLRVESEPRNMLGAIEITVSLTHEVDSQLSQDKYIALSHVCVTACLSFIHLRFQSLSRCSLLFSPPTTVGTCLIFLIISYLFPKRSHCCYSEFPVPN